MKIILAVLAVLTTMILLKGVNSKYISTNHAMVLRKQRQTVPTLVDDLHHSQESTAKKKDNFINLILEMIEKPPNLWQKGYNYNSKKFEGGKIKQWGG